MGDLNLRSGGNLFYFPGPGSGKPPKWVDVTDQVLGFLFYPCTLEEGLTLRDLFLLIRANIDILEPLIGNWMSEIVSEGLDKDPQESDLILELSWEISGSRGWAGGMDRPHLGGIGPDKEDNIVRWAVEMTPVNQLIDCPLRFADTVEITENYKVVHTFNAPGTYTLGNIIHGVIWELSFHGSPTDRDAEVEELNRRVTEIESGEAVTYSMDEFVEHLEELKRTFREEGPEAALEQVKNREKVED